VSPIDALRTRRSLDDLPPVSSDDELVEWARGLTASADGRVRRERPLRVERERPLRAERAPRTAPPSPALTTEEVFAEISRRVAGTRRPKLRLRVDPAR
jgi:hypothetical protein